MPGKTLPFPTIAQKIETLAQEPTARLFSTVRLANGSTKDISYRKFLSIVNKAALWLDANLPKPESADDFPTFQYVGNLNLRLLALVVAAEKTGRKVSFQMEGCFMTLLQLSHTFADSHGASICSTKGAHTPCGQN